MIAGYSKCGDVGSVHLLFDQMTVKDLLFNAMITCFAQMSWETLQLFNDMIMPILILLKRL